jgi:RND family efflux transporter MFP subunit
LNDSKAGAADRRWRWRILVLLILVTGVGGVVALQVFKPQPAVKPPARQLPLVRVVPMEFREGALAVSGNGLVKPRAEIALAAEVSGKIAHVSPALVTGGSFARGDILVRLDAAPFQAALAQATADKQSARVSLDLAEQHLKRTEQLIAQGFLSRQTLDERIANRDSARAALARNEAAEKSRHIDLERTVIRAPFKGKVLSERISAGETVQPGKELARLFADDTLEIAVSLTDRDVALIADLWQVKGGAKRGAAAAATVTVDHGGNAYQWPARVDRVEAGVDSATRTFNVVVRIDNPATRGKPVSGNAEGAPPLLVGMYASVEIAGREVGRHAMIPRRALRDNNTVWLLADGETVAITPVQVLSEFKDSAAVRSEALREGARVIITDLRVVTQGMPVRVVDESRHRAPGAAQ